MLRLAATCLFTLLAAASTAEAATVGLQDSSRKVRFEASAGEVNRVAVVQNGLTVSIVDHAAPITVEGDDDGCVSVSANEARCSLPVDGFRVQVDLGDGDDEATASTQVVAKLDGGDGADTLTGGDGADELDGGGGNDRLHGGAGTDTYDGGDGDDAVLARDSVREDVDCGLGVDHGEADVEDQLLGCEGVERPLAPPTLADGDNGLHVGHAPKPERGQTVAVAVKTGVIYVRRPGGRAQLLDPSRPVPVGSVLDARRGTLTLTAATGTATAAQAGTAAGTQTADFTGARFVVAQKSGSAVTELRMVGGNFVQCRRTRRASRTTARAAARKRSSRRKRIRRLWGSGHGRFTTRGRNSSATVRGTVWSVEDRCDGTLTRVTRGVVAVSDFARKRTKVVRAGESYLARGPVRRQRRR